MAVFESILCLLALASAAGALTGAVPQQWALPLLLVTAGLLLLHVSLTSWRWQLWPVWLLVTVAIGFWWLGAAPAPWLQVIGTVACAVIAGLSLLLVLGLPVPRLPAPDGPCRVGSVSHAMTDPDRPAYATAAHSGRQLLLKIWYPASPTTGKPERLWQSVQSAAGIPAAMKVLTRYLTGAMTHTMAGARFLDASSGLKVLLYNHGMISFAAENTLLMEHLASHGYVVIAVQHVDQSREFNTLNAGVTNEQRKFDAGIMSRLKGELGRRERAELTREWINSAMVTPKVVAGRTADSRLVLDRLDEALGKVPGLASSHSKGLVIGALGLSLGGAISTELGKTDSRVAAVINLDGGLFGAHSEDPIAVPYLMVYSTGNEGSNDLMLQSSAAHVEEFTLPDSLHTDLHDATLIAPLLRWLGVTASRNAPDVIEIRNRTVSAFFDAHLANASPAEP